MTTIEIAQKLGISRGTVSRVINGHPNVNAETRRLVLAELEASGYRPNEVARSLVMKRSHRIAIIVFSEPRFFWEQVRFGVNTAAAQLGAMGVTADYFITDILRPEEQLALLRRLPGEGYGAIAIAPNDVLLLTEEIDKLSASGMPVLLLNVDIPAANRLCYVGCDYEQAGALAAEILCRILPAPGELVALALQDPVISIGQRITGFRRMLSKLNGPAVSQVLRFSRMAEGVYDEVLALLRQNEQIRGIYVALGALEQVARAVIDSGRIGTVAVVGHDLSHEIYGYMRQNAIDATICHEPYSQGYYAVKLLHNYLLSHTPPNHTVLYCKLEAIFRSNAQYYLNQADQLELLNL